MRAYEIINEAESESAFEQRCLAIVRKVAQYASPADREIMNNVEVLITNDPDADDRVYSSPEHRVVVVDMEEFGPAPTSVLIWLIAHELCHIVMNHKSSKTISAQASQQQEQSADKYANELML
jgi:predicted metal-dependent peptidase